MDEERDLTTKCSPTWCPGCGNFGTWAAFKNAALKQGWDNTNTLMVTGIGCHGNIYNFTKITSFEGLHGRAIPVATGAKLANSSLNVFVFSGDGDCLGEGGNHLIHASRRNHDLTIVLHNNELYGLTTGQTSPATPHGSKTKSSPAGNLDYPFSPIALAIAAGATFVARAYSTDIARLAEIMIQANEHKGLSFIEVLQPCVTFDKEHTHQFFQQNTYQLDESYDPTNKEAAFAKALEWGEKQIPLGIFYQTEKPSYESEIVQIKDQPLIKNTTPRELQSLFKKYT